MTRFLTTTALALGLGLAAPASAQMFENLSADDRAALGDEIRSYLLENPELIVEVITLLEEKRAAEMSNTDIDLVRNNADAIFDDGYSFVGGNPDGSVTMVEFLDYRCGYCKKAHEDVKATLSADGDIRYVVKEFPILGPDSETASRAAIAVLMTSGDEAYAAFNDALMRHNGPINDKVLSRLAEEAGASPQAMLATMQDEEVSRRIMDTRKLAAALQINGTPTFVIGEQMLRGYVPQDAMISIVDEQRQKQN
ncbi:DsbA family protein [Oceanomicrobium pacificus]|uniref:Thioredoxin domain-containing protein n=1 Tax=Oceanomicrobium pacificus TaxID=2692916 RepID=A0A6B0U4C4_9RHOB|nr:DsbA family protein [Oceanomicrobium pacificus]MXU65791.1 thioredoxin domain-containing protein [Oceanomicrobium pacificus]